MSILSRIMKSMRINKNCIFCNKTADTREHIPAKNIFKNSNKQSLITVPSCKDCNSSFQKDDDFFRQFFTGFLVDKSSAARQLFNSEVTRSIMRKPALGYQMFKQMKLVDAYTPSGLYMGKRTVYKISDTDKNRVNRVVEKIIKGLFYHEFRRTVPNEWEIKKVWITQKKEVELGLSDIALSLRWRIIKEDIFAYGYNFVPDTFQSIWILDFFKTPLFYVLVLDRETTNIVL